MRLKVGAATSVGRVRPINEDAFLARPDEGLFVVCDGMGGAAAGEVASSLAVETIGAYASTATDQLSPPRGFQPRTNRLGRAIESANRAILDRAREDAEHAGMGTTVVGAWIADGLASFAHVGDSRAYVANQEGFEALTLDHSLVEAQVQAGLIDREQSLKSEHQNILLRALGRDPDVQVELGEIMVGTGDRLLLCTDGLTRMVSDQELAEVLSRFRGDPQGACDHLVAAANDNGGPDNVTVIVVEVQGSMLSNVFDRFRRSTFAKATADK
jgi:serine/threonine protein phosphatase PrpC